MFDYLKTIIKHRFLRHKGFTLLETIFAVLIIVIAFIAIFSLVNFGISSISVSKNKLIAAELSQEGLELVRWWRETDNSVPGVAWTASNWTNWYTNDFQLKGYFRFLINPNPGQQSNNPIAGRCPSPAAACPAAWPIDTYGPVITNPSQLNSFFQLWYDPISRIYNHNAYALGSSTNFYRIIHISSPRDSGDVPPKTNKRVITCEVFWVDRGRLNSVKAVDYLYNWL